MKARGMIGEYCQTCAETLHAHYAEPHDVIALCNECLKTFKSTGDYDRFKNEEWKKVPAQEQRGPDREQDDGLKEQHEAEKMGFTDRVREKVRSMRGE